MPDEKKPPFYKQIPRALIYAVTAWSAILVVVCVLKYAAFEYHDLDLAYFSQVVWNTAHGQPFVFTIHPALSLADHAEWILLPLALVYFVFRSPMTLLALQVLALGGSAIPLYIFAKSRLPKKWALGVALAYLALAVPMNAALFEFHALIFALPFLLFAAVYYDRADLPKFLIFIILALLVREDVTLAVLGFAAVAAIEKRNRQWVIWPAALALGFLALDYAVIRNASLTGAYKFGVYYSWLAGLPPSAAISAVVRHLFTLPVWEFLVGLTMPVLVLPFIRPRWLFVSALPILGIVMQGTGGGATALEMHYAVLALAGVLLAATEGLATLLNKRVLGQDRIVLAIILILALAASQLSIGPLPGIVKFLIAPRNDRGRTAAELTARVPPEAGVAASDALLPALANRRNLYALKYVALGTTQYGAAPYALKTPPEFIALDAKDALTAAVQYPNLSWTKDRYPGNAARLRDLLAAGRYAPVWQRGDFSLWQKNLGNGSITPVVGNGKATGEPTQVGNAKVYSLKKEGDCGADLCLALTLSLDTDPGEDLAMSLELRDKNSRVLLEDTRIIGDQLAPTHEWAPNDVRIYRFRLLGVDPTAASSAAINFFRPRGALVMGPLRSSRLQLLRPTEGTAIAITK